jgi:hypothetical protein
VGVLGVLEVLIGGVDQEDDDEGFDGVQFPK